MAAFVGVVFYATLGVFLATLFRDRAAPLLVAAAIILAQVILISLPLWSGNDLLQWVPRVLPGNALGALLIATEREMGLIAHLQNEGRVHLIDLDDKDQDAIGAELVAKLRPAGES